MKLLHRLLLTFFATLIFILHSTTSVIAISIENQLQYFKTLQDLHIMMFVGFGFLSTFLKKLQYTSVGITSLLTAFTIQWCIFTLIFFEYYIGHKLNHANNDGEDFKVNISIYLLMRGDLGACAVLVSYGALLGKISTVQAFTMAFLEMIFYSINEVIGIEYIAAQDIGGSMYIHLFGAVFGVTISYIISKKNSHDSKNMKESYESNLFAMIGTIFLLIYWPSFNAGFSTGTQFHRIVVNTALALTGSVVSTFITSSHFNNKFRMEDVLNASLAGGVIIGTSCDMIRNCSVSLVIGFIGGLVSTCGFNLLNPYLVKNKYLYDTCGVLQLHGIPGFLGGVFGAINAGLSESDNFQVDIGDIFWKRGATEHRNAQTQTAFQFAQLFITIAIAIFGGIITGFILKQSFFDQEENIENLYSDEKFWEFEHEQEDMKDSSSKYHKQQQTDRGTGRKKDSDNQSKNSSSNGKLKNSTKRNQVQPYFDNNQPYQGVAKQQDPLSPEILTEQQEFMEKKDFIKIDF